MEGKPGMRIENTVCSVVFMLCVTFLVKGCMDSNVAYDMKKLESKDIESNDLEAKVDAIHKAVVGTKP